MDPSIFMENSVGVDYSEQAYLSRSQYSIVGTSKDLDRILSLSLEEQAAYADQTCRDHCTEIVFLEQNLPSSYLDSLSKKIIDKSWMYFRSETLGNLAYIALNSVEPYTNRARNTLLIINDTYKLYKPAGYSKWNICVLY